MSKTRGIIKKVAGPLVIAEGMRDANMYDVVRVSEQRLIGEVIEMHGDQASIQVYEETQGLGPGAPVESMEVPLSVELGPGLIGSIYDGIQRPLNKIMEVYGVEIAVDTFEKSIKKETKKAGRKITADKKKAPSKKKLGKKELEESPIFSEIKEKKPAKRGKKKVNAPVINIQSPLGGSITPEEILTKVGTVDAVYIRVDENKAYWVRGEETGSVDLW